MILPAQATRALRCVTLAFLGCLFAATVAEAREGPILIPEPQSIQFADSEPLTLVAEGSPVFRWEIAGTGAPIEEAKRLIEGDLGIKGDNAKASKVLRVAVSTDADELSQEERSTLSRNPQAYIIRKRGDGGLDLLGASPIGAYYAATTFVQLLNREGKDISVPVVTVLDWPDIPRRESSEWLIQWWELNSYDWGDGPEKFVERCKRKIDLYARHKVNIIGFVSGKFRPHFSEAWQRILAVVPELNDYAARKGVALQHTLTCYGGTIYDWGLTDSENYWLQPRESYPDGKLLTSEEANVQTLSHEPMNQAIREDIVRITRELRPRSLYLHWADAIGRHTQVIWQRRGSIDRQAFPDDDIYSPIGMAGAVAKMYSDLIAAIQGVNVPEHNFDAARDMLITIAGPNYGKASLPSEQWEMDTIRFWAAVAPLMTHRKNTTLCIREVYLHDTTNELMPAKIAQAVAEAGWPNAISMMSLIGGGFDFSDRLFVSTPIFTNVNRGAEEFWTFNGHVNQEILVLANVNFSWNLDANGAADLSGYKGPELYETVKEYAMGKRHSDYLYGGWMDRACELAYGSDVGPHMAALLRLERDTGSLATSIAQLDKLFSHESMRHLERFDFTAQIERSKKAKEVAAKALLSAKDPGIREDMEWLNRTLDVSIRMCGYYDQIFNRILAETGPKETQIEDARAGLEKIAGELREWLKRNFQFEKVDPFGGEPVMWMRMVDRLENRAITDLKSRAATAEIAKVEGVAVSATSENKGYAALSVLTSDPTGKGWGRSGGWCSAKRNEPPETLTITFDKPREVGPVDIFTLADDWKLRSEVTRETPAGVLASRSISVEIRDADDGNWIAHHTITDSKHVWMTAPSPGRPVTGIRFIVNPSSHGYSSIVHINLDGEFSSGARSPTASLGTGE